MTVLLNRKQVAEMLNVSYSTVKTLTDDGSLPVMRLGKHTYRYPLHKINEWIDESTTGGWPMMGADGDDGYDDDDDDELDDEPEYARPHDEGTGVALNDDLTTKERESFEDIAAQLANSDGD